MVKLLLEKGYDPNSTDQSLWTTLHCACDSGKDEIIKVLLQAGCDYNLKNCNSDTALVVALKSSQTEAATLLVDAGASIQDSLCHLVEFCVLKY